MLWKVFYKYFIFLGGISNAEVESTEKNSSMHPESCSGSNKFPDSCNGNRFDTAVVSEAEAQEADVEDFGAEEVEAAEDTTEEMTEDIQQDEAADDLEIQEDAVAEEADPVSDGEDEFSAGDDTEEAFSDESQLKGEYQYVYAGLTWGEYWALKAFIMQETQAPVMSLTLKVRLIKVLLIQ